MPRKPSLDELKQFNLKMPKSLIEALDEVVDARRKASQGAMVNRSDIIREACSKLVAAEKKARGKVGS